MCYVQCYFPGDDSHPFRMWLHLANHRECGNVVRLDGQHYTLIFPKWGPLAHGNEQSKGLKDLLIAA